jgi:hypothetical protein
MKCNPYHTYLVVVGAYLFGTVAVGYEMHVQNFPHPLFVPINYGEKEKVKFSKKNPFQK